LKTWDTRLGAAFCVSGVGATRHAEQMHRCAVCNLLSRAKLFRKLPLLSGGNNYFANATWFITIWRIR